MPRPRQANRAAAVAHANVVADLTNVPRAPATQAEFRALVRARIAEQRALRAAQLAAYRLKPGQAVAAKTAILRYGLNVSISVQWLADLDPENPLLALVITPLKGFVHLVQAPKVSTLTKDAGMYHISIGFKHDIDEAIANGYPHLCYNKAVQRIFKRWDGFVGTIFVNAITGEGCVEVGSSVQKDWNIYNLHKCSAYYDRKLHISM